MCFEGDTALDFKSPENSVAFFREDHVILFKNNTKLVKFVLPAYCQAINCWYLCVLLVFIMVDGQRGVKPLLHKLLLRRSVHTHFPKSFHPSLESSIEPLLTTGLWGCRLPSLQRYLECPFQSECLCAGKNTSPEEGKQVHVYGTSDLYIKIFLQSSRASSLERAVELHNTLNT